MSMPSRTLLKIIVLGDSGVGKTSLLNQYVNTTFKQQYKASIGADFFSKELLLYDKLITLQIWDTAGQERFHGLAGAFYRGADCCILVYDVNDAKTFGSLQKWHQEFLKHVKPTNPEMFPFVLIGNKVDVDGGYTRSVSEMTVREWCASKGNIPYHETSAKENINIAAPFESAAEITIANGNPTDIYGLGDDIPSFCDLERIPDSISEIALKGGGCAC